MIVIGFDFETHLIGPEQIAPPPVCLSTAVPPEDAPLGDHTQWDVDLGTTGDKTLHPLLNELLEVASEPEVVLVAHRAPFDLSVAGYADERLWEAIFKLTRAGKIKDTLVREKMLNLAEYGEIDVFQAGDSGVLRVDYSLAGLVKQYLHVDIAATKKGLDAWRTNYSELEDLPLDQWPDEALDYAIEDSIYVARVYLAQEERRRRLQLRLGADPLRSEDFRLLTFLALTLLTCEGVRVDKAAHDAMRRDLAERLKEDNMRLLIQEKILRPAKPARPYANGARDHADSCTDPKSCACPPKMTEAKKASINRKRLIEFVEALADDDPDAFRIQRNEPTDRNPAGSMRLDKEFFEEHRHLDATLNEYHERQRLQKLITTELPRMEWPRDSGNAARVVHPSFDFLKKTGRTSSYAGKLAPGFNCQQIDPRARSCFIPRRGYYFYSVDVSAMELCTLAQKCYSLFGYSKLRDAINKGYDVHAYLGSQLAVHLDPEFRDACADMGASSEDEVYAAFVACKSHEDAAVRKFYKHYRTFAKPTGLGYPGGLGPKTFVGYARSPYGVIVSEQEAFELRDLWFRTYPEMREYFSWIKNCCQDPLYPGSYQYSTPFGLIRSGATFCQTSNGAGLQGFSAEGALTGLCSVVEATYVESLGSTLYRDEKGERHRALMFVHDEIIGEARIDCAHEVAYAVRNRLVDGLRAVCPDVKISAEPALMTAWDKRAETVLDPQGRLIPWTPKEAS